MRRHALLSSLRPIKRASTFLPDGDVENVGSDGGGDGHVAEALPGHDDARDEVGDGGARRQERQTHHLNKEGNKNQLDRYR